MPQIDEFSMAKLVQLAGEKISQLEKSTRATLEHELQQHKVIISSPVSLPFSSSSSFLLLLFFLFFSLFFSADVFAPSSLWT